MPNYQNSKIYKLVCSETNKVYVGSTTAQLVKRKCNHNCKHSESKIYNFVNPTIHILEEYPCNSLKELRIKEREWYDKIECVNERKPYRTKEEENLWRKEYKKNVELKQFKCECGVMTSKSHYKRHTKTKKHSEYLFSKKNICEMYNKYEL